MLLRTVWDFQELFETSRTVREFRELSKIFLELFHFDTSENYVRSWEHFRRNHGRKQWPFRAIVVSPPVFLPSLHDGLASWLSTPCVKVFYYKGGEACRRQNCELVFVEELMKLFCSNYWQNTQITAAVYYFRYNFHQNYHYHHFQCHCQMQLYRRRILLMILYDSNMIPRLFQVNFVFFLPEYIFF